MNYDKHAIINAPVGMKPNIEAMVTKVGSGIDLDEYYFVTTHFNIAGFDRTAATYFEWLPTLGPIADRLNVFEMVLNDDEPQIPNSIRLHGTRPANCVWQKEALLNIALRQMPEKAKYFCWLDHDLIFENPNWFDVVHHYFNLEADAIQLFSTIRYLDMEGKVSQVNSGRVRIKQNNFQGSYGNPGGPWIATRECLEEVNGFYANNILGGGDQMFFSAILDKTLCYDTLLYPIPFVQDVCRYLQEQRIFKVTYLDSHVYHLYHGSKANRRYGSRYELLVRHWFDPAKHLQLSPNGLLQFSSEASPILIRDVLQYFEDRKEDE